MKLYSKSRTIASMILAPVINFLMGQIVVVIATIFITTKLSTEGVAMEELLVQVTNEVLKYNVHLTGIASLITLPIAFFLLYEKQEKVIKKVADYGKLFLVIPFGVAVCVAANMLITVSHLPEIFPTYEELAETIFQGNIFFELLAVGMLPAIVEELIYRGVLYKGFKKFVPIVWANLISSFIFGAMHMNMVQFVYATILGSLFAWVYERYKSLWAPILMHMAANMFSVLMTEWTALADFLNTGVGSMIFLIGIVLGITFIPILIGKVTKESTKKSGVEHCIESNHIDSFHCNLQDKGTFANAVELEIVESEEKEARTNDTVETE